MAGSVKSSKSGGYTLIEIMVAATIFAAVFSGVMIGVSNGFSMIDKARHHTRVSQLLQSEMETLRTNSWADLEKLPAEVEINPDVQFGQDYFENYTVKRVIQDIGTVRKLVTVSASWVDRSGRAETRSYSTIFTKEGLNDYYYRVL